MVKILCHSVSQNAQLFKIVPTKDNIEEEFVIYLEKCVICDNPVLQINRIDIWGNKLEPVRLKTKNIEKFLDTMSVIWKPRKINFIDPVFSKFALNYNEYGNIKQCRQNLSNLHLGKIETDPYFNLIPFKNTRLILNNKIKKVN